ncbi:MAG: pilus assembly protein PilM [Planctomycetota bacterium]|nr:pilus assembly protein PilM [Planctomycetota bacterium]
MALASLKKLNDLGQKYGRLPNVMGLPIAVDFGVSGIKVLQLAPGSPHSLVAAAFDATPEQLQSDPRARLLYQLERLPKVIRSGGFKGERAVCAVPASAMVTKHLQLPRGEGLDTSALVQAALASQLGCEPAALVHRFLEVGTVAQGAKQEVIGFAAGADVVQRLMSAMKASKLQPVGIHAEALALSRAFDTITRRAEDAGLVSLYLDVGSATTKVVIAHGWDPVFARTIELGGASLDRAVAKHLKCDATQARRRRLELQQFSKKDAPALPSGVNAPTPSASEAGPESSATPDAPMPDRRETEGGGAASILHDVDPCSTLDLTEPLEMLTDEVMMCLRYHQSIFPGRKPDRLVFVGGEARHRGLCQHIAKAVRVPAQVADPLASIARTGKEPCVGVDMKEPQPGWAVAVGLCVSPTDL